MKDALCLLTFLIVGAAQVLAFLPPSSVVVSRRRPFCVHSSEVEKPIEKLSFSEEKSEENQYYDPLNLSSTNGAVDVPLLPQMTVELELPAEVEKQPELDIWVARGILLFVAAIWGTNFASVKYLEQLCFHPPCNHPPSEFAFARFGVAALVSLPLLVRQRWDVILAGFECGAWVTLGYITQAVALSTISAGKCAFICSLTVVVVPIISWLLYGRPIKATNVLAAIIALCGVGVLENLVDVNSLLGIAPAAAETASAALASTTVETAAVAGPLAQFAASLGIDKGDFLALGQPLGFGCAFIRIEHYQEKFKDVPNRILTIAAAQCVAVGAMALLWVLHDYSFVLPNFGYLWEPHRIATILWTGIVTTVFAIFLEGIALQKATATDAAITFSSEPVWASIFGFMLLGEQLGMNSYVGGAIILMACLVGSLSDMTAGTHKDGHSEHAEANGERGA